MFPAKFLVFLQRSVQGLLVTDGPGVGQNLPVTEPEEVIQLGYPVAHIHRFAVQSLQLGEFQAQFFLERLQSLRNRAQ